jgi:4-amino-4-deoxy-L-arabinose transferase-like glycosyltransferase
MRDSNPQGDKMKQLARDHALVAMLAGLVFFANLGGARLWDRDEPRNAACAREMLQAGDWVVPRFNGELRDHKPVLLYWFMMSAYAVFGQNEFAARFWSAALAVGTVVATHHIGRRLFSARVGVWSGVILASTFMFDMAARAATPDSVLIFFTTAPLMVYVLATFAPKDAAAEGLAPRLRVEGRYVPSWPACAAMYALMGVAVLAKGPVGLVLPTAVIGMFLLIVTLPTREHSPRWLQVLRPFAPLHFLRTCWTMRPLTAIAVAGVVAVPWYVWVHVRTDGAWTHGFFVTHNLGRATAPMEGHDGSIFFYPAAILVGFFPWSVFAAPLAIHVVRKLRQEQPWLWGYIFAACWVGVYVGLFSIARTKLPSYITPMYPGLALLAGCFVHHWTRGAAEVGRIWPQLAMTALAAIGVAILVAIPLVADQYAPGEGVLGLMGLIPLTTAAACLWLIRRGNTLLAAQVFAAGAVLLTTGVFSLGTARADRHQHSDVLLRAIRKHSDSPEIVWLGRMEPSWVFYAGQPIREIATEQVADPQHGYLASGEDRFVITTREVLVDRKIELPEGVQILAEAPYFMRTEQLVVLGRRKAPLETASRTTSPRR